MDTHGFLMEHAVQLARRSVPMAGTNPPVGALIVRGGAVIGEGFHRGPGTAHAEIAALADARRRSGDPDIARGAELWCTLEPCCHSGGGKRTPPCAPAIIEAGIKRVFIACRDPNPRVSGGGVAVLEAAGIPVAEIPLAEADALLEPFAISIRRKRPFVRLKWAQSLDGYLACATGSSKWISPEAARAHAHGLRATHDAVLVGAGTLAADDPELTVRLAEGRDPRRVLLAGGRPLPAAARILSPDRRAGTLVAAAAGSPAAAQCLRQGWPLLELPPSAAGDGRPDLDALLAGLYAAGVGSLLVEGGGAVLDAFIRSGRWDAATVYVAPAWFGAGVPACRDLGLSHPAQAPRHRLLSASRHDNCLTLDLRPDHEQRSEPEAAADRPQAAPVKGPAGEPNMTRTGDASSGAYPSVREQRSEPGSVIGGRQAAPHEGPAAGWDVADEGEVSSAVCRKTHVQRSEPEAAADRPQAAPEATCSPD
jgi:diaminohydroxyphosphoribosylaminopyrimidine deaminase/5-amino-6-(5-phosphoribosylamino)uracil reductase